MSYVCSFCVNIVDGFPIKIVVIRVGFELVWNVEKRHMEKIVNVRQSKHRLTSYNFFSIWFVCLCFMTEILPCTLYALLSAYVVCTSVLRLSGGGFTRFSRRGSENVWCIFLNVKYVLFALPSTCVMLK